MPDYATLASALRERLDSADPDAALVAFTQEPLDIEPLETSAKADPVVCLAARFGAGALLIAGLPERVEPWVAAVSDAVAPPYGKGEDVWRLVDPAGALYGPLIEAALACRDQALAVKRLIEARDHVRSVRRGISPVDAPPSPLASHPNASRYGPAGLSHEWLIERYERAAALGPLDDRLAAVRTFHAGFAETALLAEAPERAMPLIEAELERYLTSRALDNSHFEFDAICVLAALKHFDRALDAARRLVRRGYHQRWRFDLAVASDKQWVQEMRQNEWLADLSATPQYRAFLKERPRSMVEADPRENPLCLVKDGVWSGKKPKRCRITRAMIQPGEPVVRYRQLFLRSSDGGLEVASRDAFEDGPWAVARRHFETDTIPIELLFPSRITIDAKIDRAPFIHEFVHDVAKDPKAFDVARAATLIGDHHQPPIAWSWVKPGAVDRWVPAIPLHAGDDGHGDAVNLVWRIVKAGYREPLIEAVRRLADGKADKVFAMLATFDDERLRAAAAEHFDLPDLPDIMATVFKDRLTIEDHEALAEFGHHERYRAAIVSAMRAYALHLYSNTRPKADWFLAGLDRFIYAGGSPLLYFLINHPQDDPVLETVIEKAWLPERAGGGSGDEYLNAQPFYVRATLFHLARHKPEKLADWLDPENVPRWCKMAYDRETMRLMKKVLRERRPLAR